MDNADDLERTDRAFRIIEASPQVIYQALTDPEAVASWLPPEGMKCRILAFEPWTGGAYQVALLYDSENQTSPGKTSAHADVVKGRFVALSEDEQVVQRFGFESDDPAFAGTMTMTWQLTAVPEGTKVMITCEGVPRGYGRKIMISA